MMVGEMVITVMATKGSTPREEGATLHVGPDYIRGTIGGGHWNGRPFASPGPCWRRARSN